MTHRLIVRPKADQQAANAYLWYEDKVPGLGDEYLLSLDACINAISKNPNIYQKRYKNIRVGIIDRFPFGIYYIIENDLVVIMAILHFSQNSESFQKL